MKPRKLFIIGNGFDLHHGLKTSYADFKNFIEHTSYDYHIDRYLDYIRVYDEKNPQKDIQEIFWSDLENTISKIDIETLLEDMRLYLERPPLDEKWSDSYWGDYQYEIGMFLNFGIEISDSLRAWIKEVERFITPDIIDCDIKEKFLSDSLFFSFNYTDTIERVYNIAYAKVCHIHGFIMDAGPLICGGEKPDIELPDFASTSEVDLPDIEGDFRIDEGNDIITRWQKTIEKDVSRHISNNFNFFSQLEGIDEVIVMGHSLGKIDMPYFIKIRESVLPNAKWTFYYYQPDDKKDASKPYRDFATSLNIVEATYIRW